MNLGNIFARAFVRRLAYVLAAIVFAWCGIGNAQAQQDPRSMGWKCMNGSPNQLQCDEGEAFLECLAFEDAAVPFLEAQGGGTAQKSGCSNLRAYAVIPGVRDILGQFGYGSGKSCANRTGDGDGPPANSNAILVGSGNTCWNGCAYSATLGEGSSHWSFFGGQTITYSQGSNFNPTGQRCDPRAGEGPGEGQNEYCAREGEMTQCLMADGRHCAITKSGQRLCWRANEAGTKNAGNEAVTKSPEGVGINPPPQPPKNNGDWQQGQTGTASVTQGGVTNNYNITNFNSTYGPSGSGGGAEPGTGGGDGDGGDGDGDESHVGGDGTCTGSFSCSGGDPVLCALAQQTYQARCEASDRFDGEAGAFPGDGDGGAGEDPGPEAAHRTVTVGLGMLDEGGFLGGGQCPQFGTIEVMGRSIQFDPDGMWCDVIGVARTCLLFLGAFIALGILAGRSEG